MHEVIDKVIEEIEELRATEEFSEIMNVNTVTKWDDPALTIVDEYPYLYVAPVNDSPLSETAGRVGYDVRTLTISVGLVINVADYFDPTVSESPGSKPLVRAMAMVRQRMRRLSKRNLDGLSGVRNVVVGAINYVPDIRNGAFVRLAVMTLTVDRQYQHEE